MADHRKTLQHGTPSLEPERQDVPASPPCAHASPPLSPQQPAPIPPNGALGPPVQPTQARVIGSPPKAAAAPVQGLPRPPMPSSADDVPSSDVPYRPPTPSQIPPPLNKDAFARTPPPQGVRTPSLGDPLQALASLPENAPGWMVRARRLTLALEEALRTGHATPGLEACIERAWAAWELDGSTDKCIARVAQLMETAHVAIRESPPGRVEQAYHDVAQVVWAGLPRAVKARTKFDLVVQITRELRTEADPWAAAVHATAKILGWTDSARAHAAHALRIALLARG